MSKPLPLTRPPCSHVPLPPHQGGEGGSSVDPSGWSEFSATPRHHVSPSLGLESGPAVQDDTAVLPANPSLAPRGATPPPTGRGLGAGGPAGSGPTALRQLPALQLPALQNTTGFGTSSPSWADVVWNGSRLDTSPPAVTASASASTTSDFLALYNRCISNGLKTRINMCNSAGVQEITLTCQIPSSFASAPRCRRRHCPRRCGEAVSDAVPSGTSHPQILSAPPSTWPETPPLLPPAPEPLPTMSPPAPLPTMSPPAPLPTMSPPAPLPLPVKRTRKAAKRCCEVELLRGVGAEDDLYVPPLLLTPPQARSPPSPLPPCLTPIV